MEYIYLLREREFIKTNESIYKIGKTKQNLEKRFQGYPKGSEVTLTIKVNNCDLCETQIKRVFDDKFKNRRDIGREYYEGDVNIMKKELIILCDHHNDQDNDDDDDEICPSCQGSGISYWSDGVSGTCMECGDINADNIYSYSDYIEHSLLAEIIIIDKTNYQGYVRFKNKIIYRRITENPEPGQIIDGKSDLTMWLIENYNGDDVSEVDFDSVIIDILDKCYRSKINIFYPLKDEYLLCCNEQPIVFDTKDIVFKQLPKEKFVLSWRYTNINTKNINTNIVKRMLSSYVDDKYLYDFAVFFRGVLRNERQCEKIWRDSKNKEYHLWEFMTMCMCLLGEYTTEDFYTYYDRRKNYDYRFVIIDKSPSGIIGGIPCQMKIEPIQDREECKIIRDIEKSTKNIIILGKSDVSYRQNELHKFIKDNQHELIEYIQVRNPNEVIRMEQIIKSDKICPIDIEDIFHHILFIDIVVCLLSF